MISNLSGPPPDVGGTLVNSIDGPGAACRERQPPRKIKKKRSKALSGAKQFKAECVAAFGLHWSNRRRKTRWQLGAKRLNLILGGAVSSVTIAERVYFLKAFPSYSREAPFANSPGARRQICEALPSGWVFLATKM